MEILTIAPQELFNLYLALCQERNIDADLELSDIAEEGALDIDEVLGFLVGATTEPLGDNPDAWDIQLNAAMSIVENTETWNAFAVRHSDWL